jgi:nucleoside 2-deoxyribosyltransferase
VTLLYLASPYSHYDPAVREARYMAAIDAAAGLMEQGYHVISPIVACHPIAILYGLPMGYDYWLQLDERLIEACDAVCVLMIDGAEQSVGVAAEIKYARGLGKSILKCNERGEIVQ